MSVCDQACRTLRGEILSSFPSVFRYSVGPLGRPRTATGLFSCCWGGSRRTLPTKVIYGLGSRTLLLSIGKAFLCAVFTYGESGQFRNSNLQI